MNPSLHFCTLNASILKDRVNLSCNILIIFKNQVLSILGMFFLKTDVGGNLKLKTGLSGRDTSLIMLFRHITTELSRGLSIDKQY